MTPSMETWAPTIIFRMGHSPCLTIRRTAGIQFDEFLHYKVVRVLSGIPEIDKLEHELALPAPELVGSVDQVPPNIEAIQISAKTRGLDKLSEHSGLRRVVARGIGDTELEHIGRITTLEQLELVAPTSRDLGALRN